MLSSALKVDPPQSYFLKRNTSLKIQAQNGFSLTLKTVDLRYLAVLSTKRKIDSTPDVLMLLSVSP